MVYESGLKDSIVCVEFNDEGFVIGLKGACRASQLKGWCIRTQTIINVVTVNRESLGENTVIVIVTQRGMIQNEEKTL